MKVILVNGSPKEKGCTYRALIEVSDELNKNGIDTEIFHIGTKPLSGCMGCGGCSKTGECVYGDAVNRFAELAAQADGFVFGSPVHYAAASGALTSFLDRAFMSAGGKMRGKVGASVVSCRRGGASAAFDQMNKYFTINSMPIVSSQYWNQVHGSTPEEVEQDLEGLQTMRTLAKNMAWLLKCIELGKQSGITIPEQETKIKTSFIR